MNIVTAEKTLKVDKPASVLGRETIVRRDGEMGLQKKYMTVKMAPNAIVQIAWLESVFKTFSPTTM